MVQAPRTASTIGTTHGTPASVPKLARLMSDMATTTTPAPAITPILITVRLTGGATSPLLRRRWSANHRIAPSPSTMAAMTIQLSVGSMVPDIRLNSTCTLGLWAVRFGYPEKGPSRSRISITPLKMRNPASVTTNEGIPSRVMIVPWRAPTAKQKASAAMIAAHHGQLVVTGWTSWTAITAPHAPTKPIDRSISPSRRANVSAIASTMNTALCWKRLTRLPADRNTWFGLITSKTTKIATRPRTTGSTPLWPFRTRATYARAYSPKVWATSSGGTSACAAGAAVRAGASSGAAISAALLSNAAAHAAGGHVLDDTLAVELGRLVLDHHPAQVEHGDAIGDLEHIDEVVRYDHDREATVTEALDQVEHLPRLIYSQGGGGLVHDHELGVPHHRLRDGDRLALPSGQGRYGLADGPDGRDAQAGESLGCPALHLVLVERPAAEELPAQEHVLDDVEVVAQGEVLVDGLDSEPACIACAADVDRLALPEDLTVVGHVHAGDALGENRFAGSVVSAKGGHLSRRQVEVDCIERLHGTEVLLEASHL